MLNRLAWPLALLTSTCGRGRGSVRGSTCRFACGRTCLTLLQHTPLRRSIQSADLRLPLNDLELCLPVRQQLLDLGRVCLAPVLPKVLSATPREPRGTSKCAVQNQKKKPPQSPRRVHTRGGYVPRASFHRARKRSGLHRARRREGKGISARAHCPAVRLRTGCVGGSTRGSCSSQTACSNAPATCRARLPRPSPPSLPCRAPPPRTYVDPAETPAAAKVDISERGEKMKSCPPRPRALREAGRGRGRRKRRTGAAAAALHGERQ